MHMHPFDFSREKNTIYISANGHRAVATMYACPRFISFPAAVMAVARAIRII